MSPAGEGIGLPRNELAGIEQSLGVKRGLEALEGDEARLGNLLLHPRTVLAAHGVVVGERAAVIKEQLGDEALKRVILLKLPPGMLAAGVGEIQAGAGTIGVGQMAADKARRAFRGELLFYF